MTLSPTQTADNLLSCVYDIIDFELANAVDPVWPDTAETTAKPEFRRQDSVAVSTRRFNFQQSFVFHLAAFRRAAIDAGEQDAMTLRDWSQQLSDNIYQLQYWEDSFAVEQTHEEFANDVLKYYSADYDPKSCPCWAYMEVWKRVFAVQLTAVGVLTDLATEHFTLRLTDETSKLIESHMREGISAEELAEKVQASLASSNINFGAAFGKFVPRLIGQGIIEESPPPRFLGLDVDMVRKTVKRERYDASVELRGDVDWGLFVHLLNAGEAGSTLEKVNNLSGQPDAAKRQSAARLNVQLRPIDIAINEWRLTDVRNADVARA